MPGGQPAAGGAAAAGLRPAVGTGRAGQQDLHQAPHEDGRNRADRENQEKTVAAAVAGPGAGGRGVGGMGRPPSFEGSEAGRTAPGILAWPAPGGKICGTLQEVGFAQPW
ncbi:hypothetical protein Ssi03_17480 [Sphaerisporangium siamense]|nr:hypothetical protein Ssi03_17480 [Sphaerisporangium siamense]